MPSQPDACADLVVLAARLAGEAPSPRRFVRALARDGAGIRGGPLGLLDLARGGRNRLRGRGFRRRFDDGSTGQVRHFCGVLRACHLLGPTATRRLLELSGDAPDSADGRLTEAAISLVADLRAKRVTVAEVPAWIDHHVCSARG